MDIQIRALDNFMHGYHRGRLDAEAGGTYSLPQSEAEDLVKRGMVEIVVEDPAPQTGVTDSQAADENLDDLVGGDKAEPEPENKMAPAPANKGKK